MFVLNSDSCPRPSRTATVYGRLLPPPTLQRSALSEHRASPTVSHFSSLSLSFSFRPQLQVVHRVCPSSSMKLMPCSVGKLPASGGPAAHSRISSSWLPGGPVVAHGGGAALDQDRTWPFPPLRRSLTESREKKRRERAEGWREGVGAGFGPRQARGRDSAPLSSPLFFSFFLSLFFSPSIFFFFFFHAKEMLRPRSRSN